MHATDPGPLAKSDRYSIARAWTPALAKSRFVPVVRAFLENYSSLKPFSLTHGEAMFVIHLMQYKWDEAAPFPGYKRIARLMGVSDKMVRRYALSLEQKGYLLRVARRSTTNRFDLRRLFAVLEKTIAEQQNAATPMRGRVTGSKRQVGLAPADAVPLPSSAQS
jgi:hypothetical protein